MEINTVPRFDGTDHRGEIYSKIPRLQFPVDEDGRTYLVQDVTYYSKAALYDAFKAWRDGGPACSGRFDEKGAWKSTLTTRTTRYDQDGKRLARVERVFDTKVFEGNVWGLQWFPSDISPRGVFPQYYKEIGAERVAVPAAEVPAETRLQTRQFPKASGARPTPRQRPAPGASPAPDRPVHGHARRRFRGDLLVVSLHRSALVPAIRLGARRRRPRCKPSWKRSTRTGRSTAITCHRPAGELSWHSIPPCS